MRRILVTVVIALGAAAFAVFATGAGSNDSDKPEYWVEFDNAFGLIEGGDLKIAGTRAGKITELKLADGSNRALVGFQVTETGFGSLRTDVFCESRPQSLIGEYYIDCQPGTNAKILDEGSTIPVEKTASTVPPDLVNNVLRRPYRERLSIIVNELGAAVAGNGDNLNTAVRRAAPALRETDKVLRTLGKQNKILRDLTANADTVIGDLAENRADVQRWVEEAGNASRISATRQAEIAAGFRELPKFLEQLGPAMRQLGAATGNQTPALRDLDASAVQLKTLFDRLGPFADASKPAVEALAKAGRTGSPAVKAAGPTVDLIDKFATGVPELGKNLAIVLEHLDDRSQAAEHDPRAAKAQGVAGPSGYSGLEALLQYVFDQAQSTSIYDRNAHILAVSLFAGECAEYASVTRGREHGEECGSYLGPTQPGLNRPDPYLTATTKARERALERRITGAPTPPAVKPEAPKPTAPEPTAPSKKPLIPEINLGPIKIPPILPGSRLPEGLRDGLGNLGGLGAGPARTSVLDYLMAP